MTVPKVAGESRFVWNCLELWYSSPWHHGYLTCFKILHFTPSLRSCKPPECLLASLSCLLFICFPFSSLPHEGNPRAGKSNLAPSLTSAHRIKLFYRVIPITTHSYFLRRKCEECQVEPTQEKKNFLNPLTAPIKFWIVVLLPSFDSAFIQFLAGIFVYNPNFPLITVALKKLQHRSASTEDRESHRKKYHFHPNNEKKLHNSTKSQLVSSQSES